MLFFLFFLKDFYNLGFGDKNEDSEEIDDTIYDKAFLLDNGAIKIIE
jgi:hypothetical protein